MSREPKEILDAALTLPEEERAELVMKLLDSIRVDPSIIDAQATESASRLQALKAGEAETLDHDDALRIIAG